MRIQTRPARRERIHIWSSDELFGRQPVEDNEELDAGLIDSQYGDRFLFDLWLRYADVEPTDVDPESIPPNE